MSNLDELLQRFRNKDRQALSRLLTLVSRSEQTEAIREGIGVLTVESPESRAESSRGPIVTLDSGLSTLDKHAAGSCRVVAITGSGGVGKSSLIGRLVELLRSKGKTVAVLACDPQSPLTGGALLGDRVRISPASDDSGVFIRSLAAAGGHQAIARNLDLMAELLSAFGFEVVLLETVGAGQGDTAVGGLADVLVLLLQPQSGDSLQWEKAGLLEVADVVVVNKSDLPGAEQVEAQVRGQLNLPGCRAVPVLKTSAAKHEGLNELWDVIDLLPSQKPTSQAKRYGGLP